MHLNMTILNIGFKKSGIYGVIISITSWSLKAHIHVSKIVLNSLKLIQRSEQQQCRIQREKG